MKILVLTFIAACLGAVGYYLASFSPAAHGVVCLDTSKSVYQNCDGVKRAATRLIDQKGMGKNSTLAVLVMGSGPNDPEPKRVFEDPIPVAAPNVYGRDEVAANKAKDDYLRRIAEACEAAVQRPRSPILRMVQRAVEHLRRTCSPSGNCYLLVKTDLEEDVDDALTALMQLAVNGSTPAVLPPHLAGSINNAGIRVTFCGVAEVEARRIQGSVSMRRSPEFLAKLWTGLFTHPDLVSVEPFCGR